MPDISMCLNHKCPERSNCYRYRAVPFKIQTYSLFNKTLEHKCEHRMPIVDGDIIRDVAEVDNTTVRSRK